MSASYDVIAIGNAVVDVIAHADFDLLAEEGLTVGSMQLIDMARARHLYTRMRSGKEVSGGSAANTVAGMASLGRRCRLVAQVANDQLGEVFADDIRSIGVEFGTAPRAGEPATARCLIFVTPDGERTMNTFLGASQCLAASAVNDTLIASAEMLYLEGYLWDADAPRTVMRNAMRLARAAGRKVAFTLSDEFVISRHGADFRALIKEGLIDILFGNESEVVALTGHANVKSAIAFLGANVPTVVVTHGAAGAEALSCGEHCRIAAERVERVVDSTRAGDLFASGFLTGQIDGRSLEDSLALGAVCAAEAISHFGSRPETNLRSLAASRFPTP